MPVNPLIRIALFPFSFLYAAGIYIRNWLYDSGYLKTVEFDFPVICVGNLSAGGTGKTPHVEYLIRLLSEKFRLAILSRGYMRKSHGYVQAEVGSSADAVGDEPALLKRKYPHVAVAVCEDRALGVPRLLSAFPQTDAVILDDAFQHRAVRAGLNILLTCYNNLFTRDHLLPAGNLREFRSAYKRAEFIVVTKCPVVLPESEREKIKKDIAPSESQLVFFSFLNYGHPYLFTNGQVKLHFEKTYDVLLVTGIASAENLKAYVTPRVKNLYSFDFGDHYRYERNDIERITEAFGNIESENKLILTTEKDAVKLIQFHAWIVEKKLPIFVQPVSVEFFEKDKKLFDEEITGWLQKLKNLKSNQT